MAGIPDDLFGVRPAEFVEARNALAKQLSAEGRRDEAKEIKALRRPSTVVWAMNQLARRNAGGVDALLAAGAAVRKAQQGGGGARLRDSNDELQRHVLDLARAAEDIVLEEGVAASVPRRELEAALRVAALGGEAGDALRTGRFVDLPEADEMDMWSVGDIPDDDDDPGDRDDSAELEEAQDLLTRADAEARRARELVEDLTQRVDDLEESLRRERAELEAAVRVAEESSGAAAKAADRVKRLRA